MENVIDLKADNNIKFKAIQYFSSPPLMIIFSRLKTAKPDDYRLLVLMKRIRESLGKEGLIVDDSIKTIKEEYASEISELPDEPPSEFEINLRINEFLQSHEISIPFPKLMLSQIKGIESLSDLDALEGIVDVDIEE